MRPGRRSGRLKEEVIAVIVSRRWEDWAATLIGALVALSPLVFTSTWTDVSSGTAYILGGLILVVGIVTLILPEAKFFEWVQAVLAVVLFFSPWLFAFTAVTGMAWMAWIAAIAVVLVVGSRVSLARPGLIATT
jgi:SPW repeat